MYQYNDYELLYLIYECDSIALGILFDKYDPLIRKKIYSFRIKRWNYDDFYQECLLTLLIAIRTYNPFSKKSFNKYLDLLLNRKIITLLKNNQETFYGEVVTDDEAMFVDEESGGYLDNMLVDKSSTKMVLREKTVTFGFLSSLESRIFRLKYIKGLDNEEIAKIIGGDIKKVYNSIYQLKKKIKSRLPD